MEGFSISILTFDLYDGLTSGYCFEYPDGYITTDVSTYRIYFSIESFHRLGSLETRTFNFWSRN